MKKAKTENDELRPEYQREDFGEMVRGKYALRCREATNVVVISPDVQKASPMLRRLMMLCVDFLNWRKQPA